MLWARPKALRTVHPRPQDMHSNGYREWVAASPVFARHFLLTPEKVAAPRSRPQSAKKSRATDGAGPRPTELTRARRHVPSKPTIIDESLPSSEGEEEKSQAADEEVAVNDLGKLSQLFGG